MPINYSKWDALELSDDSDVEVHPNVDKKSFIRMKQRKIHQDRAERKEKIRHLTQEGPVNAHLIARIDDLITTCRSSGHDAISTLASELASKTKDSTSSHLPDGTPNYDYMVWNLLQQVSTAVKDKNGGVQPQGDDLNKALEREFVFHKTRVLERDEKRKEELAHEEREAKRHITSEDVRDGFDVSFVDKTPSLAVHEPPSKPAPSRTKKKATSQIEVLNPSSVGSTSTSPTNEAQAQNGGDGEDENDEAEDLPTLKPSALAFSKIQPSNYEMSFKAIAAEPSLYADETTTDALLVEAFEAELRGEQEYAKGCVHQALLLQYCRKLGKDGVALFFKRVLSGDKKASGVFFDDVQSTYIRISGRCATIKAEREASPSGKEQIQLVAQDDAIPSFDIPTGPPPETLVLGDGAEHLNVEDVRKYLEDRWQMFLDLPVDLQEALKKESLEEVNKVLGAMEVEEAEGMVEVLQKAGILSFGGAPGEEGAEVEGPAAAAASDT